MKIKIQQFLFNKNHSWSVVGKSIARALIRQNHDIHLFSTDGISEQYVDDDLRPYIRTAEPKENYDMQLSYTAMLNFPKYLANGNKNRFGIWCYEFTTLPTGFAKYHNYCDLLLPPSKFSYDIFAKNGIPESKMKIVPHGIDFDKFKNADPYPLKTKKKYKLFANIAQPHIRKNIPGMLEVYGKAFERNDDVCLVLKVVDKKPEHVFELKFSDIFNKFQQKYKNHAEIEIIKDYIPKIESLYKAVDILFMIPNTEGFFLPAAEMLADKKIVITSNYGGQLDFLNKDNSILVDGKIVRAPKHAHYWTPSVYSEMFEPNIDDAVEKLRYVINNYDSVKERIKNNISDEIYTKYSWDTVTSQIISYVK